MSIEHECIQKIITEHLQEKTPWWIVGGMLHRVDSSEFFLRDGSKSFTSWVVDYSQKSNTNGSTLWRYLGAYRFFEDILKPCLKKNKSLDVALGPKVSAEAIELLSKLHKSISPDDFTKLASDYFERAVSIYELRSLWRIYKSSLSKSKVNLDAENRTEKPKYKFSEADIVSDVMGNLDSINVNASSRWRVTFERTVKRGDKWLRIPIIIACQKIGNTVEFVSLIIDAQGNQTEDAILASQFFHYTWLVTVDAEFISEDLIDSGVGVVLWNRGGITIMNTALPSKPTKDDLYEVASSMLFE